MNSFFDWFQKNLDVVFFIYGLFFFIMATAIFARNTRETKFKLAGILRLLGWFGLIHGANEWLDGWTIIKGRHPNLDILRFFALTISYLFLFEFGRQLLLLERERYPRLLKKITGWLTAFISPPATSFLCILGMLSHDLWETGTILARYLLGVPAGILISLGFLLYYKNSVKV